ncbi:MAG: Mg/Co/Ni transporter MgtE / CBS domain [uncultured Thiotrichaceae bacterium]|uniref:Magnesium transporter MgtE n=1 Tax=uncultured Thiotrichaceae bacterium TaxID=298394 RepID=A0A6S6U8G1_9GAMM|nr:MAG: Mg/Co/Ni transporter MgtE / CBS domain [uncultured Thiotrichaceae bacterium]
MTEINTLLEQSKDLVQQLLDAHEEFEKDKLQEIFASLEAVEIAHLLESIPDSYRGRLWQFIDEDKRGDVLVDLCEVARRSLVDYLEHEDVVEAVANLDSNDLAEMVDSLPNDLGESIRSSLDYHGLKNLEATLAFPEGSAGRLMETEAIAIRSDITLETVLRFLRKKEAIPDHTVAFMVVDRNGMFMGELPLSELLTRNPSRFVSEVMNEQALSIHPEMTQTELAVLFRERDLVSVPMVDDEGKLVGRVTLDDMVDIMHEEADHQILGAVGLDEDEDLFSPIIPSAKRRLFWLGINLGTAFLAAWVIGLFEGALDKIVALAVLMPIVASMGGIAGSQTLTLMIRGLATGKISGANSRWLAYKEIAISVISGVVWAVVVGLVSYAWFNDYRISLILGAAMIINLLVASISGFGIPMIMKRFGIDPALAGGVVLTTATDVVGFVSFLGLATVFLL